MPVALDEHLKLDLNPTLAEILAKDPTISSKSRWSSPKWYFDGECGGKRPKDFAIHWPTSIPKSLLNDAKFLAALLFLNREGRAVLKPSSAPTFSAGIRHTLYFMSTHCYSSFSQLDMDAFKLFNEQLHINLSNPAWFAEDPLLHPDDGNLFGPAFLEAFDEEVSGLDDVPDLAERSIGVTDDACSEDDELTRAAAAYRLRTWQYLNDNSEAMKAAGAAFLRFNPFETASIRKFVFEASSIAADLIPPLPDLVAIRILGTAQTMLGEPAEDVLRLQDLYLKCIDTHKGASRPVRRERIREVMQSFVFSSVHGVPWYGPLNLSQHWNEAAAVLRDLINCIRDAGTQVIFGGVGPRISELCSLPADPDRPFEELPLSKAGQACGPSALPPCVSATISKTGMSEHFFMHGLLFKHQSLPREETWLIGARPRGDAVEPPVVRAIRVLDRLFAPWRSFSNNPKARTSLIVGFKSGSGLPEVPSSVIPISGNVIRDSQRRFVKRFCHLGDLADEARTNHALRPYVESEGACIRPHQWRKTLARYMIKVDERMIAPLARHYKHMSIAVTENSYVPRDPSMLAAQDSVQMQETARFFFERRHAAGGSFGRLHDVLAQHQDELEKLIGDLPFEEALPPLQHYCLDRDIRIFHTEYGRCLFGANPVEARCHEVSGTSSWRNSRPNYLTRTSSLCSGCINFSVSIEHAGYWRRRYIENERAWLNSGRRPEFRVFQKRAQQAASVLQALGLTLPEISNGTDDEDSK